MRNSKFNRVLTGCILAASVSLLGTACSKKEEKKGSTDEAKTASSAKVEAGDPVTAELRTLVEKCEVVPASSSMKCKGGEQRKLITDLARQGKSRVDALKVVSAALKSSDAKMQTVAANVLHLAFRSSLGTEVKPGSVTAEDAKALIETVAALPKPQATQAVPATVHAAMLAGQQDALYKMLDARATDKLGIVAYRYLMTHGRLGAFEKVKELSANQQLDLALAALASPTTMRNWTAEEQAQLCPWAKDLLGNERPAVATRAASLLANCTGPYVDTLLDKGEELLKAGKLSQAQITPFRDVCSPVRRKAKDGVTDAQCDRNRKFLEKVLNTKEAEAKTKVMALSALAYQWPDAATLKVAQKLQKDPDKELARRAEDTVKRLERRAKTGTPDKGETKPASAPAQGAAPAAADDNADDNADETP